MDVKVEDLTLVTAYAEGYHSGSVYQSSIVVEQSFLDSLEEDLYCYSVDELNGKNSETQVKITTTPITQENLKQVITIVWDDNDEGDDRLWDYSLNSEVDCLDVIRQQEIHEYFVENSCVIVESVVKWGGVVV